MNRPEYYSYSTVILDDTFHSSRLEKEIDLEEIRDKENVTIRKKRKDSIKRSDSTKGSKDGSERKKSNSDMLSPKDIDREVRDL